MFEPASPRSVTFCPPKPESKGIPTHTTPTFGQLAGRDSVRFAGNKENLFSSPPVSQSNGSFREQCRTKFQQWKSCAEKHYNWLYKQAVTGFMVVAAIFNGLPMPSFLRKIIERRYFFSPPTVSSLRLIDQERYPGLRHKIGFEIKFQSGGTDNHELAAWYIPAKPGKQTVVFSHGRASNISDLAPILKALSNEGYGAFAYDYPGFGNSEGKPTEENLYEAGVAACKFLAGDDKNEHKLTAVPYNQQILMGHSLGGAVAVDIAKRFAEDAAKAPKDRIFNQEDKPELRGQPQALVVVNTFTDIKRALTAKGQDFHWALQRLFSARNIRLKFNSAEKISEVSMPILVLHGDKDNAVSMDIGAELFSNVKKTNRGRFQILPDVKHKLKDDRVCETITGEMNRFLQDIQPGTKPIAV